MPQVCDYWATTADGQGTCLLQLAQVLTSSAVDLSWWYVSKWANGDECVGKITEVNKARVSFGVQTHLNGILVFNIPMTGCRLLACQCESYLGMTSKLANISIIAQVQEQAYAAKNAHKPMHSFI